MNPKSIFSTIMKVVNKIYTDRGLPILSPYVKIGTRVSPWRRASLMNPFLCFRTTCSLSFLPAHMTSSLPPGKRTKLCPSFMFLQMEDASAETDPTARKNSSKIRFDRYLTAFLENFWKKLFE